MLTQSRHRGPSSHMATYLFTETANVVGSPGHRPVLARGTPTCQETAVSQNALNALGLRNSWRAEQVRHSQAHTASAVLARVIALG